MSPSSAAWAEQDVQRANLAIGHVPAIQKPDADVQAQLNIPDTGSPAADAYKMTDGVEANGNDWSDPTWFKLYRDSMREVVVDLKNVHTVDSLSMTFAQRSDVGISPPFHVRYYASNDGVDYAFLGKAEPSVPLYFENVKPGAGNKDVHKKTYKLDRVSGKPMNIQARFIKMTFVVEFNCWADEIQIMGVPGIRNGAEPPVSQPDPDNPIVQAYPAPGSDAASGIRDQFLLPTGAYKVPEVTNWTKEKLLSVLGYRDMYGNYTDWLFDDILFATVSAIITPSGFDGNGMGVFANMADYRSYLDFAFRPTTQLGAMNEAAEELNALLGTNRKVRVTMAIPKLTPSSDFGDVRGDGSRFGLLPDDFRDKVADPDSEAGRMEMTRLALENQKTALRWYVDEVERRFREAGYDHLELTGFYWNPERVFGGGDIELIRRTAAHANSKSYVFTWIPYLSSLSPYIWKELGFTSASIQPNYAFNYYKKGVLPETAKFAKKVGAGVEIEYNDYHTLAQYMNFGVTSGYMEQAFNTYYLATTPIVDGAHAFVPLDPAKRTDGMSMIRRSVYDRLYEFVKDRYEPRYTMRLNTDVADKAHIVVVPGITLANGYVSGEFTVHYDPSKTVYRSWTVADRLAGKASVAVDETASGVLRIRYRIESAEDALFGDLAKKQDPVGSAIDTVKLVFSKKPDVPDSDISGRLFAVGKEGHMTDKDGRLYRNWSATDIVPGSPEDVVVKADEAVRKAEADRQPADILTARQAVSPLPGSPLKSSFVNRLQKATMDVLKALIPQFAERGQIDHNGIANSLSVKLNQGNIKAFAHEVSAQRGKHISVDAADTLSALAAAMEAP
ncbi:DUF4855 domain-containing protein [Paenibacillus flagellatus]|uniref:F5/8 type C domain-containing protein n=1 Tax=Paenibacillus flagellatus TaxID=2211139 RepID=A0A2V5K7Y7_9BACL|nr:DUF4855 domain-containing protein [Paenibacillus flagellatus]PYI55585.1 hypothetical protein DLM86_07585 [Paenibacillus flagellatus]